MRLDTRIVDVSFFLKEMHRTFDNHARGIECQYKDWILVSSRRCGFQTQFFFKCQMYHYEANFWSQDIHSKNLDINTAITAGSISAGIGYAQLEEMYAAANIPCMSEKTYIKHREIIIDDFDKTAIENMKMAGAMEKQLAIQKNKIVNGIPYITVVADSSWMKRSYGTAYDSLSGVGATIGYRTKKVLFVGIRNKFCTVCETAERKGNAAKKHKCYKNFDRNVSSTKMESDAIVEGFKSSIQMHGLIYKKVIADGDSSVYQSIIDNNPYREQMVTVKKIECINHLLRNLCKKLKVVAEMTQPKLHRNRNFITCRNVVKNNILKIRKEILEAAAIRRQENDSHHSAIELQKDILNIPSHMFGEHKRCKERGRQCEENESTKNYVPFLKVYGLYDKIQNAVNYLSAHSDSLLLNLTNNPAESFNAIICKEIGGKRINFGARGSYNARIAGAVLQHNTQQVLTQLHKSVCKTVPSIIENMEKRRQVKVTRNRECRKEEGRPKKLKKEKGTDCYYGAQSQKPDVPSDVFEVLKQNHLEQLLENGRNWKAIECDTRDQSNCELWHSLRKIMLTASNFGVVCRMRPTTSCASIVKNILFPPSIDTAAMKYGRDMEEMAKQDLAAKLNKIIKPCGLFIDCDNPYLGASPDGLLDEDGVVEIKCPLSAENVTVEEAIETLPQLKNIFDKKNGNKMNQNHRFFYQVQGQLNITQREYCMFVVWTPKSMKMVHVSRNEVFWKTKMLPFLKRFYDECMLPEILDSRYLRHMKIRNPRYIVEAKEKAAKKLENRQNTVDKDNVIDDEEETCKSGILLTKTETTTADIAQEIEQDDDCIYMSTICKQYESEEDKARRKLNLDEINIKISSVRENVLSNNELHDESLDKFLCVIRETTRYETQSVQYQGCCTIEASQNDKSLQIIGGNDWNAQGINHWRCIFFDGTKLHVYDSISGCTYDKLSIKEKNYIHLRYPKI